MTDITIEQIAKLKYTVSDPFDIDQNIFGGLTYFQWLYNLYAEPDRLAKTLAAWNWGLRYVSKEGPLNWEKLPEDVKTFIKNVMRVK